MDDPPRAHEEGDKVKVTFALPVDEEPGEVFVAGDFNAWNPGATRLKRRGDLRRASLILNAGRRYAFRYYRDGHWFSDDRAGAYEVNEYGQSNCIVDLTEPP
jgi:hypothetical protein